MKRYWCAIIFVLCGHYSEAQTFKEWFRQKKTQIEYLVKQIAGLQVYIEQARKGYEIAEKGLTTIGNIKNGDFNLHKDFFAALSNINPRIRNSAQVADLISWQIKIIEQQQRSRSKALHSEWLSEKEINYIVRVYGRMAEQTINNMSELTTLLTANQYVLSDDERMKLIHLLHNDMQDQYSFVRWFGSQTDMLVLSRRKEQQGASIAEQLLLDK